MQTPRGLARVNSDKGLFDERLEPSSETEDFMRPPSTRATALPDTPSLHAPPGPLAVRSYGLTHPGKVRPANEDQFLIAELARTLWVRQTSLPQADVYHGRNHGHLFLVADGMGGHEAGEVASALSVTTVEAFVL